MPLFNFRGLKKPQVPMRKPPLMHPDNVPRTTKKFPAAFHDYRYVGPSIEIVSMKEVRRPALVAHLLHEYQAIDGATVQEEMTASVSDLRDDMHPQTRAIAKALRAYYEKNIALEQQEEPRTGSDRLKDSLYSGATA